MACLPTPQTPVPQTRQYTINLDSTHRTPPGPRALPTTWALGLQLTAHKHAPALHPHHTATANTYTQERLCPRPARTLCVASMYIDRGWVVVAQPVTRLRQCERNAHDECDARHVSNEIGRRSCGSARGLGLKLNVRNDRWSCGEVTGRGAHRGHNRRFGALEDDFFQALPRGLSACEQAHCEENKANDHCDDISALDEPVFSSDQVLKRNVGSVPLMIMMRPARARCARRQRWRMSGYSVVLMWTPAAIWRRTYARWQRWRSGPGRLLRRRPQPMMDLRRRRICASQHDERQPHR